MPLSKAKQAKWMRQYRVKKKVLGITTNKTRGIANSVIPNPIKRPDIDADGNVIPELT